MTGYPIITLRPRLSADALNRSSCAGDNLPAVWRWHVRWCFGISVTPARYASLC